MSALAARYPRLLLRSVGYEFRKRIQFRTGFFVREALTEFVPRADSEQVAAFVAGLGYVPVDARGTGGWDELANRMRDGVIRAFYMSVGPGLFGDLAERLHQYGMADEDSRIVVEKPFGRDLESAKALNDVLVSAFDESQIYRIDH